MGVVIKFVEYCIKLVLVLSLIYNLEFHMTLNPNNLISCSLVQNRFGNIVASVFNENGIRSHLDCEQALVFGLRAEGASGEPSS